MVMATNKGGGMVGKGCTTGWVHWGCVGDVEAPRAPAHQPIPNNDLPHPLCAPATGQVGEGVQGARAG